MPNKQTKKQMKKKKNTQSIKNIIKIYYEIFNAKIMLMFFGWVGNEVIEGGDGWKGVLGILISFCTEIKIHFHQMEIELENGID